MTTKPPAADLLGARFPNERDRVDLLDRVHRSDEIRAACQSAADADTAWRAARDDVRAFGAEHGVPDTTPGYWQKPDPARHLPAVRTRGEELHHGERAARTALTRATRALAALTTDLIARADVQADIVALVEDTGRRADERQAEAVALAREAEALARVGMVRRPVAGTPISDADRAWHRAAVAWRGLGDQPEAAPEPVTAPPPVMPTRVAVRLDRTEVPA